MHRLADCVRDSVFHAIRPDGDSGTNQSLRSKKNMGSDMVAVESARPAVEAISNGPAFELKRIAESVVERRYHGCSLGPRTEDPGSWKCSWCGRANVRQHAGLHHCSACNAEAFTYFTFENELRVRYTRRPPRLSDGAVRFDSQGAISEGINREPSLRIPRLINDVQPLFSGSSSLP